MRKSLLAGAVLAVTAAVAVWLGEFFGLELESYALLGVALGAVVALVPDARPGYRLAGFVGGIVVMWIMYLVRALMLPDTANGRAVAAFLAVALCVALVAASLGRLPLWSALLGAAAMFGAYELTFMPAPPEVLETSFPAGTALLLTSGLGFLVGSFFAPDRLEPAGVHGSRRSGEPDDENHTLDNMMEQSR